MEDLTIRHRGINQLRMQQVNAEKTVEAPREIRSRSAVQVINVKKTETQQLSGNPIFKELSEFESSLRAKDYSVDIEKDSEASFSNSELPYVKNEFINEYIKGTKNVRVAAAVVSAVAAAVSAAASVTSATSASKSVSSSKKGK